MSMAKAEANERAKLKNENLKYEYKVNMNILISKMTKTLIECFYEEDMEKRIILFDKAMKNINQSYLAFCLQSWDVPSSIPKRAQCQFSYNLSVTNSFRKSLTNIKFTNEFIFSL